MQRLPVNSSRLEDIHECRAVDVPHGSDEQKDKSIGAAIPPNNSKGTVPGSKLVRLQVEMSAKTIERIDRLADRVGIRSRRDFVENALSLFSWALKEVQGGREIASVDPSGDSYTAVLMPCFEFLHHEGPNRHVEEG